MTQLANKSRSARDKVNKYCNSKNAEHLLGAITDLSDVIEILIEERDKYKGKIYQLILEINKLNQIPEPCKN